MQTLLLIAGLLLLAVVFWPKAKDKKIDALISRNKARFRPGMEKPDPDGVMISHAEQTWDRIVKAQRALKRKRRSAIKPPKLRVMERTGTDG